MKPTLGETLAARINAIPGLIRKVDGSEAPTQYVPRSVVLAAIAETLAEHLSLEPQPITRQMLENWDSAWYSADRTDKNLWDFLARKINEHFTVPPEPTPAVFHALANEPTQEQRMKILEPSPCGIPGHFKFQLNGGTCLMCQRETQLVNEAKEAMTPAIFHALANECYHASNGKELTTNEDVERVLRRCDVVVTNLAALEALREGK